MLRTVLVSLSILLAFNASAQFQGDIYVEDSTIKAYNGSVQKQLAWSGGFNNPQFTMGDLNKDGKTDMVVYDYHSNQIKTFLNVGTGASARYQYAPKYAKNFPAGNNYLILADYNRDGIPDMFNKGQGGYDVYKGYYNAGNELCFVFYKQLRYQSFSGTINASVNGADIPSIVDIDGDGDLDFFSYNEGGAIIYFFKNCQEEHGLPKDTIEVCKPTNCWGNINQGAVREFVLGIRNGDNLYCPAFNNYDCRGTRHGGNTICMVDMDGDGDYDMLDGNFSYNDLQYVKNGRKDANIPRDSIISQDTIWRGLEMTNWPAAFNVDADGDGKKDILVSPHGVNISENYRCIAFYRNTGTTTAPVFTLQTDTFLIDQGIDVGTASYPYIYDYNRDGRPDLFIGTSGYFQTGGLFRSKIAYYANMLEGGVSKLVLQTNDFNGVFAENVEGAAPAFGDLDNDGRDDMIVGHTDGTLTFYKNTAASNSVQPVFAAGVILKDASGVNVRSANYAVPFVYDITKDGKPDLLVAGQLGRVALYKNINVTVGTGKFEKVTDTLGGMRSSFTALYGYATIYVGKMDNTGKDYIMLGSADGGFKRYGGFESGNVNMSYQLLDSSYSDLNVGQRSSLTIGDLNGDGGYEMIAGNVLGGLNQFKQMTNVSISGTNGKSTIGECNVYPNPASDKLYVTWDEKFAGNQAVNIQLINVTGQSVLRSSVSGNQLMSMLQLGEYPSGMYVCLIQAGNHVLSQRVIIRK